MFRSKSFFTGLVLFHLHPSMNMLDGRHKKVFLLKEDEIRLRLNLTASESRPNDPSGTVSFKQKHIV